MEFPAEIREAVDDLCEAADTKALRSAFSKLSESYRTENRGGKKGVANETEALCYAAVRMPATFAAVSRALELSLKCFDGEIDSVLDVGAGTGAGAVAAARLTGAREVTCFERERAMSELGMKFCGLADVNAVWKNGDLTRGIEGGADLVICSYCLNELSETERVKALEALAGAAGKMLVIVDPGTPWSFGVMKELRRRLIRSGLKIAAPCPRGGECTLPEGDWCHFSVRAGRSKAHKLLKNVSVPYEDEKFCFLAAVREGCSPCEARVLRKPYIEKGRTTLMLCAEGGLVTRNVTKSSPEHKAARKAECGDSFSIENERIKT